MTVSDFPQQWTIYILLLAVMKKKESNKKIQTQYTPIVTPSQLKSPKKTVEVSESKKTKPTPLKTLDASDDDISSADKQEFLMLEIKQLKRQNNFLKKKISDLTAEFGPERPKPKRAGKQQQKQKGALQNLQSMPLSINICFQQIHNVLNTIVKLFRINFTEQQITAYEQKQNQELAQACPIKKHILLKKYMLKRKLQRIQLEDEEKRYPLFLDLFTQYYEFKELSDKKIIQTIDHMTSRTHQLNQWIIDKAQQRKKTCGTFSTIRKDQSVPITVQSLKNTQTTPRNYVAGPKGYTYSPAATRNTKKVSKFAMSPAQKPKKTNDF